jgi:anaerobic sulfite reductase subunit A
MFLRSWLLFCLTVSLKKYIGLKYGVPAAEMNFEEDLKSCMGKVLKGREVIYTFLGRVYEREVDEEFLSALIHRMDLLLAFEEMAGVDVNLKEGFKELRAYLSGARNRELNEVLLELAADYANLFLGVGYAYHKKGIPHPSESVYLTGYMYQDVIDEIFDAYLEAGVTKSPEFREPEDHIALEMYFMAYLCTKALEALDAGDLQSLRRHLKRQGDFLTNHLLKWALKLADDVIENANTMFYKAVGKITKGLLTMEGEVLEWLARGLEA